tara:strand:- start:9019 stop:10089 length:1071 start_codon:yes stop_codon:yes gene_type:complete
MNQKKIIIFYTKYNLRSASVRERFYKYFPYLKNKNIVVKIKPFINDNLFKSRIIDGNHSNMILMLSIFKRVFDVFFQKKCLVIIQYELLPYFPPLLEGILSLRKIPFVIDIDDAIFHYYDKSNNFFVQLFLKKKFYKIFSKSKAVLAGNKYLFNSAKKFGSKNTHIFPTLVSVSKKRSSLKKHNKFTVIWMGSPSTTKYLNDIRECINNIAKKYDVNFLIVGSKDCTIEPNKNIKFLDWSLKFENEYIKRCHLGIMPLRNSFWEKGKCGYKLLQYMKNEIPILASPVGVNKKILDHGDNGYFIKSKNEWEKYILELKNNSILRKQMGRNAKKKVLSEYNILNYQEKYLKIINKIKV